MKSLGFDLLPHNLPHNCVVGHKLKYQTKERIAVAMRSLEFH